MELSLQAPFEVHLFSSGPRFLDARRSETLIYRAIVILHRVVCAIRMLCIGER